MERRTRGLVTAPPGAVAIVATALSALLIAGAYAAAVGSYPARNGSLAAVGAFLLIVAIGVSLYAWRLGAPGRSD
jgi:hypothetical protein